jgi:hypothetical protein
MWRYPNLFQYILVGNEQMSEFLRQISKIKTAIFDTSLLKFHCGAPNRCWGATSNLPNKQSV